MPPGRHSSRSVGAVSFGSGTWSCDDEWMSDCCKICCSALNHIVHKGTSRFKWTVRVGGAAGIPDEVGLAPQPHPNRYSREGAEASIPIE